MFHVKPQITVNNGSPPAKSAVCAHLGRSLSRGHKPASRRLIAAAATLRQRSTMAKTRHGQSRSVATQTQPE
jgi:hypothetical protein